MKVLFYGLVCCFLLALITNIYSFFHKPFFHSFVSIVFNSVTPFVAFVYLIVELIKKRNTKKKLHEQFQKFFSKN